MKTDEAIKLDVSKSFPVPAARLYQAWINAEDLKQWWHPMGNILQHAITKPAAGAPVEYVFATETGVHSFTIKGTYKEVEESQRLVYTWNWELPAATIGNSAFLLTVVFSNEETGSRLSVTQQNFADAEAVQPHREGWEQALNDLQHFLAPL
jgi:uncharacterized protein YndB with AHSA1/START domain